jgi:hypothetical protein
VLCGTVLPEQCEHRPERRYFSTLHYLALVSEDDLLVERLKQRPAWRGSGGDDFLQRMVQFNRWLKEHADTTNPPMTLYDTSRRSLQETVSEIALWVREWL